MTFQFLKLPWTFQVTRESPVGDYLEFKTEVPVLSVDNSTKAIELKPNNGQTVRLRLNKEGHVLDGFLQVRLADDVDFGLAISRENVILEARGMMVKLDDDQYRFWKINGAWHYNRAWGVGSKIVPDSIMAVLSRLQANQGAIELDQRDATSLPFSHEAASAPRWRVRCCGSLDCRVLGVQSETTGLPLTLFPTKIEGYENAEVHFIEPNDPSNLEAPNSGKAKVTLNLLDSSKFKVEKVLLGSLAPNSDPIEDPADLESGSVRDLWIRGSDGWLQMKDVKFATLDGTIEDRIVPLDAWLDKKANLSGALFLSTSGEKRLVLRDESKAELQVAELQVTSPAVHLTTAPLAKQTMYSPESAASSVVQAAPSDWNSLSRLILLSEPLLFSSDQHSQWTWTAPQTLVLPKVSARQWKAKDGQPSMLPSFYADNEPQGSLGISRNRGYSPHPTTGTWRLLLEHEKAASFGGKIEKAEPVVGCISYDDRKEPTLTVLEGPNGPEYRWGRSVLDPQRVQAVPKDVLSERATAAMLEGKANSPDNILNFTKTEKIPTTGKLYQTSASDPFAWSLTRLMEGETPLQWAATMEIKGVTIQTLEFDPGKRTLTAHAFTAKGDTIPHSYLTITFNDSYKSVTAVTGTITVVAEPGEDGERSLTFPGAALLGPIYAKNAGIVRADVELSLSDRKLVVPAINWWFDVDGQRCVRRQEFRVKPELKSLQEKDFLPIKRSDSKLSVQLTHEIAALTIDELLVPPPGDGESRLRVRGDGESALSLRASEVVIAGDWTFITWHANGKQQLRLNRKLAGYDLEFGDLNCIALRLRRNSDGTLIGTGLQGFSGGAFCDGLPDGTTDVTVRLKDPEFHSTILSGAWKWTNREGTSTVQLFLDQAKLESLCDEGTTGICEISVPKSKNDAESTRLNCFANVRYTDDAKLKIEARLALVPPGKEEKRDVRWQRTGSSWTISHILPQADEPILGLASLNATLPERYPSPTWKEKRSLGSMKFVSQDVRSLETELAKLRFAIDLAKLRFAIDKDAPDGLTVYAEFLGDKPVCATLTADNEWMICPRVNLGTTTSTPRESNRLRLVGESGPWETINLPVTAQTEPRKFSKALLAISGWKQTGILEIQNTDGISWELVDSPLLNIFNSLDVATGAENPVTQPPAPQRSDGSTLLDQTKELVAENSNSRFRVTRYAPFEGFDSDTVPFLHSSPQTTKNDGASEMEFSLESMSFTPASPRPGEKFHYRVVSYQLQNGGVLLTDSEKTARREPVRAQLGSGGVVEVSIAGEDLREVLPTNLEKRILRWEVQTRAVLPNEATLFAVTPKDDGGELKYECLAVIGEQDAGVPAPIAHWVEQPENKQKLAGEGRQQSIRMQWPADKDGKPRREEQTLRLTHGETTSDFKILGRQCRSMSRPQAPHSIFWVQMKNEGSNWVTVGYGPAVSEVSWELIEANPAILRQWVTFEHLSPKMTNKKFAYRIIEYLPDGSTKSYEQAEN